MPQTWTLSLLEQLQLRFFDSVDPNTQAVITYRDSLGMERVVQYESGVGEGGSEVVSHYDGRLYVTNGAEDRIDIVSAADGTLIDSIDLTQIPDYDGLNSVAVSAVGVVAAVERDVADTGLLAHYTFDDLVTPANLFDTGNLPDMVTFSKDGSMIFAANEGEPDGADDPAGGITIVDVATGTSTVHDFSQFDADTAALQAAGVRIFPGKLPSTDFEPEYIAEGDNGKLYVSLQEANALAIFDLATMSWETIAPLGYKDHSVAGNGLDFNDDDGAISIETANVWGIRMPDAIAAAEIGGETYVLTANEGDDRGDWDEGGDAARVGDIVDGDIAGLSIDPNAYTADELAALERLNVSIIDGDTDGDGDIDQLYSYGSRSFTIYDAAGNLVFDSGDEFEQLIAANRVPNAFNNDDFDPFDAAFDPNLVDENRSDNKGPEPEAIAVGEVDGKTLAFIGLERDSGVMIYDISDPANATFVDYLENQYNGDISPEIIDFIAPEDSLTGKAQIAVSYEVSGTTSLYDIEFGRLMGGDDTANILQGSIGDDRINARGSSDFVNAAGGDDRVRGGDGDDVLMGGAGDDLVIGEAGDDVIAGGSGNDVLAGLQGNDVFVFGLGSGQDRILDLRFFDKIDLSDTGLDYADLTITQTAADTYEVEYGDMGDMIEVRMRGVDLVLDAEDFLF